MVYILLSCFIPWLQASTLWEAMVNKGLKRIAGGGSRKRNMGLSEWRSLLQTDLM